MADRSKVAKFRQLVRRTVQRLVQRVFLCLFHAWRSKISKIWPENRVIGLVEPIFSIFRPFSAVIFIFRGIARIFSSIFLAVAVAVAIHRIFDISDR